MQNPTDTNGKSGTTAQQADEARRGIHETQRSAHEAIDRAAGKVHPALDQVASRVHEATDNLAGAASHAADRLERKSEEFLDSQAQLLEQHPRLHSPEANDRTGYRRGCWFYIEHVTAQELA
jgi:carbonic anhydrase